MSNRLTEKNEFGYILHIKPVDNSIGNEIAMVGETANKLGQYEDLEEKYEIDDFNDLDERLHAYKFLANHEYSSVDANAYNIMLEDLKQLNELKRLKQDAIEKLMVLEIIKRNCDICLQEYPEHNFYRVIIVNKEKAYEIVSFKVSKLEYRLLREFIEGKKSE